MSDYLGHSDISGNETSRLHSSDSKHCEGVFDFEPNITSNFPIVNITMFQCFSRKHMLETMYRKNVKHSEPPVNIWKLRYSSDDQRSDIDTVMRSTLLGTLAVHLQDGIDGRSEMESIHGWGKLQGKHDVPGLAIESKSRSEQSNQEVQLNMIFALESVDRYTLYERIEYLLFNSLWSKWKRKPVLNLFCLKKCLRQYSLGVGFSPGAYFVLRNDR